MSVFLMCSTSSSFFPFTHSEATEEEAIADPHPNVLNLASSITPSSFTLICAGRGAGGAGRTRNDSRAGEHGAHTRPARTCSFITSPHAGAPTSPVPTALSPLSKEPSRERVGWRVVGRPHALHVPTLRGFS